MTRRGLILFGLMSLIWGIPYLFIRVAVEEVSPATLVFARTTVAAVILLPIALVRTDIRSVLERWRWVVAFAVAEIALPWVALGSAEQHIPSSLAGLLVAGVPLVATVIAVGTGGRDRVGPIGVLGLLIGLAGVALIVGVNLGSSSATAFLEMAVVVVGYAIGPAILARPTLLPSAGVLEAVAVLGLVCTAAAFLLFSALIEETGPVRATVITYLNPAVATLLGVAVLSESFTAAMGVGFGLVILGSVLATRPTGSRSERRSSAALDAA